MLLKIIVNTVRENEYSIEGEKGKVKVVDASGNQVSDIFYEIRTFSVMDRHGFDTKYLLGKIGSAMYLLIPPTGKVAVFTQSKLYFHEIEFRSDIGVYIINRGACWYIIDSKGRIVSDGFHAIYRVKDSIIGDLGSKKTLIKLVGEVNKPLDGYYSRNLVSVPDETVTIKLP